jgi:hypothetical protein
MRGTIQTEEKFSQESLLRLTHEAGAEYLVLVSVDRPLSKTLKVTVQAFDADGKQLWEEAADSGMNAVRRSSVMKNVMAKLSVELAPHVGKPGLPTTATEATPQ